MANSKNRKLPQVQIPTTRLEQICNPFDYDPWGVGITRGAVAAALLGHCDPPTEPLGESATLQQHAARIAYFVKYGFNDPVSIDVGVPALRYFPEWIVVDGNHRLAAAIYARYSTVHSEISGDIEYAKELFELTLCPF